MKSEKIITENFLHATSAVFSCAAAGLVDVCYLCHSCSGLVCVCVSAKYLQKL